MNGFLLLCLNSLFNRGFFFHQVLGKQIAEHAYNKIVDFDLHFDDVSKDWTNPSFAQLQ